MPLPDGARRQPSDYLYPLRTWTQGVPDRSQGKIRDRATGNTRNRADAYTSLIHKLQSIVIPQIEFRQTTLSEAVELLRLESRRLDPDPNPGNRGVNIFLRLPKPSFAMVAVAASVPGLPPSLAWPTPADPNGRITLMMERMPLLEALKYVAFQAGLKVAVEPYAVSVVPQSYVIQSLVTDEYGAPPELLGQKTDAGNLCSRVNLEAWFEAKGVDFPPGASAIYLTSTRMLIVRNTQENLDKMVSVISSALKTPAPSPANP